MNNPKFLLYNEGLSQKLALFLEKGKHYRLLIQSSAR